MSTSRVTATPMLVPGASCGRVLHCPMHGRAERPYTLSPKPWTMGSRTMGRPHGARGRAPAVLCKHVVYGIRLRAWERCAFPSPGLPQRMNDVYSCTKSKVHVAYIHSGDVHAFPRTHMYACTLVPNLPGARRAEPTLKRYERLEHLHLLSPHWSAAIRRGGCMGSRTSW